MFLQRELKKNSTSSILEHMGYGNKNHQTNQHLEY